MKPFIKLIFAAALPGLLFSGCAGYQLGDAKPAAYLGISKVHVPPFRNETLEPRLSSLVTNAVLKELQADGTYQVSTRSSCDAVLVGVIKEIRKGQLRSERTDTLRSRELTMFLYVDFHMEDPTTGARIGEDGGVEEGKGGWENDKRGDTGGVIITKQGRVIGEAIQFVDPSFQVGERNELSLASQDVATKLVSQLANGW